ncbi:MAG: hypothetical protein RLZZ523_381 [Actinomycetota bacterium]|jgi:hypothetical protein
MTIQKSPMRNAPIIVGASQRGLSSSNGFVSAATGAGRLSFLFLRMRDLGMAAGYTKGWVDGQTDTCRR